MYECSNNIFKLIIILKKHVFNINNILKMQLMIPLMKLVSDSTNVDLHDNVMKISLTKVAEGGKNTTQVSTCVHRIPYQCWISYLIYNIIILVSRNLLLLNI